MRTQKEARPECQEVKLQEARNGQTPQAVEKQIEIKNAGRLAQYRNRKITRKISKELLRAFSSSALCSLFPD
jgi:hypothetical protein